MSQQEASTPGNADEADAPKETTEIGSELAAARQRRSLSLADVSRRTKIGVPLLQAMERDDLHLLPR